MQNVDDICGVGDFFQKNINTKKELGAGSGARFVSQFRHKTNILDTENRKDH